MPILNIFKTFHLFSFHFLFLFIIHFLFHFIISFHSLKTQQKQKKQKNQQGTHRNTTTFTQQN